MYKLLIDSDTITKNRQLSGIQCILMNIRQEIYNGDKYQYKYYPILVTCPYCNNIRSVRLAYKSKKDPQLRCNKCKEVFDIKVTRETIKEFYANNP